MPARPHQHRTAVTQMGVTGSRLPRAGHRVITLLDSPAATLATEPWAVPAPAREQHHTARRQLVRGEGADLADLLVRPLHPLPPLRQLSFRRLRGLRAGPALMRDQLSVHSLSPNSFTTACSTAWKA